MNLKLATLLAALLLSSPHAYAKHYKLFVLTGQSNSLGTTNGGEADPTSGSDPADQHVLFSWHNIVGAGSDIGISGQTLDTPTLTADFTTLQDQQGGVYGGSASHWGGEIAFARSLYRAGVRDFGVIKASRGGGGNSFWLKGAADDHMYSHVVNTVSSAVASLDPGDTYEIVGLMYLQGESDSASEAAAAGTRLKALTDNLRVDLANASNLHTVAAGTTAAGNSSDVTSRANQAAIAANTSYIDYFDNTDLAASGLSPDGLHLNKYAKTIVGRRWAQAFLNASVVDRHYGNLVFIGDSITQGGNGDHPSYRYQVFKNLANVGVPINASAGYKFVGSLNGGYLNSSLTTPDVNGQTFENNHDGHYGWRAMWQSGRVALPTNRRSGNRGEGTILNWTGQASPQQYVTNGGTVNFPDLTTSGTGVASPYTAYTPDTASIMIGINESTISSATQLRDDIGTMIDQLRSSNANVRIHLNQLLYSDNVPFATVDAVNALLPQLVIDKNAASSTSPVWLVEANEGFVPSIHTYDNTHPNTRGETQVGDIISQSLGLIETAVAAATPAQIKEKATAELGCFHYEGSDIYNSGSFASNWTTLGTLTATPTGGSDIQLLHTSGAGVTLDGTSTGWSTINHTQWTFETRIKFNDITNGFAFWLGTGTKRILVTAYADRTQSNSGSFNVAHNNHDSLYHTYRITHDPANSVYHVWRDDVLLTGAGDPYDATYSEERLLMGDYTSASFGNNFDVTIDYVGFCQGFKGNEIHNGTSYINSWSAIGAITPTIENTDDLKLTHTGGAGSWLEGTSTGWSDNSSGNWTFEMRAKMNDVANGFALLLETGSNTINVQLYNNRTENSGGGSFSASHTNNDGQYHTFRVTHDTGASAYHVFRDNVRLTPVGGVAYDGSASLSRMVLGDTTGSSFGDNFDISIDYINVDYTGVWIPEGTDTDADGISDLWEDTYFSSITGADPAVDSDGDLTSNLNEYLADTHPGDKQSYFKIESITETSPSNFRVTVPSSSAARSYTLFHNADLISTWTAVSGQGPFMGNSGDLHFDIPKAAPADFYRVDVALPN